MTSARIVTTSFATLGDGAFPPANLREPTTEANLATALGILDAAGAYGPDLVVLPEGCNLAAMDTSSLAAQAEVFPGPAFAAIAEAARKHRTYVLAGLYTHMDGDLQNLAVLFDREGELVGTYAKIHPTLPEMAGGVRAGSSTQVFETDFGRVGVAICFDIHWPRLWQELQDQGAGLVCWLSAYEGGLPLRAYAWRHRYTIASSTWPYLSEVIGRTGHVIAATTRWDRIAVADVHLDEALLHIAGNADRIPMIQARYGNRVTIRSYTDEHLFTLGTNDPSLSADAVITEFGLTRLADFLDECERSQVASSRSDTAAVRPLTGSSA